MNRILFSDWNKIRDAEAEKGAYNWERKYNGAEIIQPVGDYNPIANM